MNAQQGREKENGRQGIKDGATRWRTMMRLMMMMLGGRLRWAFAWKNHGKLTDSDSTKDNGCPFLLGYCTPCDVL